MRVDRDSSLEPVHEARRIPCAETVVNIDYRNIARATVQHPEQRRQAVKTRAVADTSGHGDHWSRHQTANYSRQRTLHARADSPDARHRQTLTILHQAVNASDADVIDRIHFIAHHFDGYLRLFSHGKIAGARADNCNFTLPARRPVPPESNCARRGKILYILLVSCM